MEGENINNINDNKEELKINKNDDIIEKDNSKAPKEINIESIFEKIKQNEEIISKLQEEIININKKNEENKTLFNNEISELKKKYELSKQRENLLKEKIKALEEKNNVTESLNKNLMTTFNEMYSNYKGSDDTKKKK